MKTLLNRFLKDESGATAIEYGLIAALLSVAVITALTNVGETLKTNYEAIDTKMKEASGG